MKIEILPKSLVIRGINWVRRSRKKILPVVREYFVVRSIVYKTEMKAKELT